MRLLQYHDIPEGGWIPDDALITIGDITGIADGLIEQFVVIQMPLPAFRWEHDPMTDYVGHGRVWLRIFFATGIAPMGRWRIGTWVPRPTRAIPAFEWLFS